MTEVATETSESLRAKLDAALEQTRFEKWKNAGLLLGGAAVGAVSEAVYPESIGPIGLLGGVGLMVVGGSRLASRMLVKAEADIRISQAAKDEQIAKLVPDINPPYGVEYALQAMQLEQTKAEAQGLMNLDRDDYRRYNELGYIIHSFNYYQSVYSLEQCVGQTVLMVDDAATAGVILDEYLPIDQEKDQVVPRDEATGEKSWATYLARCTEESNLALSDLVFS